ncbi:MAG: hypothetical protein P8Z50_04070 [candidate division WOR-3 bacterium]
MLRIYYLASGAAKEAKKYVQINAKIKDKNQAEYINYSIRTLRKTEER